MGSKAKSAAASSLLYTQPAIEKFTLAVDSEARLDKPVDCVLLGVIGAWCIIAFKRVACPSADTLYRCGGCIL